VVDLLPDQLRLMASAYPDEVAYRNLGDGSSITFGRWEFESNRLAHGLQAGGVRKGDLVAIDLQAGQIFDFIVAYAAVHKIGAVSVPMNNRLSPPEVRAILEQAEITAVVCSGAFEDAVAPLWGSLASLTVVATVGPSHGRFPDLEDVKSADATAIQVPLDETDLADVMYTSGTTGIPKGVVVRHGNIALLPNALPSWNGLKWLTATPVFTFAGLGFIYNPMKAGMTVMYLPKFDAGRWLDIVAHERPVIAFVVPAMARLLIHHPEFDSADLSSLKRLILGSAPLAPDTLQRLQTRLPGAAVLNSYGMTEGGHATFAMDPDGARTRPGAVGRPTPPVEVRIVADDGEVLPVGEIGEVITRNPKGHREYYRNPEATARMWEGGWLHTGDLGRLDADGYLYIVGRKKEMVVRGGMNVYADEVEAVLQAHPEVVEAAVIGVPHDVLGEDVAAYVALRPEATVSTAELKDFAGERLADYKVPRQIHYLPALPRNPGGKVLKSQLVGGHDEQRRNLAGPQI
jgi:acyl-CoA synthetase (AMP-forming)/AMP-acid ligase II